MRTRGNDEEESHCEELSAYKGQRSGGGAPNPWTLSKSLHLMTLLLHLEKKMRVSPVGSD